MQFHPISGRNSCVQYPLIIKDKIKSSKNKFTRFLVNTKTTLHLTKCGESISSFYNSENSLSIKILDIRQRMIKKKMHYLSTFRPFSYSCVCV